MFGKAALVSTLIIAAGCTRLTPDGAQGLAESAMRTVLPFAVDVAMRCFPNNDASTVSNEVIVVDAKDANGKRGVEGRRSAIRTSYAWRTSVLQPEASPVTACTSERHEAVITAAASIVVRAESSAEKRPVVVTVQHVRRT